MSKVIVCKKEEGNCIIIIPAPDLFIPFSKDRVALRAFGIDFSDVIINEQEILVESGVDATEEILAWVANKDVPDGYEWRVTDKDNIPQDRYFRDAWHDDEPTETVDIDIDKAREIHMDKIRKLRDKKLKALDIQTLMGVDVQAEKQVLRDIPQNFDLTIAETPEELKALIPNELLM